MFELWAGHRHAVTHSTRKVDRSIPDFVMIILPVITQFYLVSLLFVVTMSYVVKRSRVLWIGGLGRIGGLGIIFTGIFLMWNLFHVINFGAGRYHVPLEPFLAVIAASGLSTLWSLIFTGEIQRNLHWRFW